MPHYNVMGVPKAALEASVRYPAVRQGTTSASNAPLPPAINKTLAAAGIGDFRYMLKWNGAHSPMRRTVSLEKSAPRALSVVRPCRAASPARWHHVDSGYQHRRGRKTPPDARIYPARIAVSHAARRSNSRKSTWCTSPVTAARHCPTPDRARWRPTSRG